MYSFTLFIHSWMRWVMLALLLWAIADAWLGYISGSNFNKNSHKIRLFTLISSHIQLIVGLILYFIYSPMATSFWNNVSANMKNKALRFWGIEHLITMLLGIVIITVGYSLSKRASTSKGKYFREALFYTIGLLVVLSSIPWPTSGEIARPWFRFF